MLEYQGLKIVPHTFLSKVIETRQTPDLVFFCHISQLDHRLLSPSAPRLFVCPLSCLSQRPHTAAGHCFLLPFNNTYMYAKLEMTKALITHMFPQTQPPCAQATWIYIGVNLKWPVGVREMIKRLQFQDSDLSEHGARLCTDYHLRWSVYRLCNKSISSSRL